MNEAILKRAVHIDQLKCGFITMTLHAEAGMASLGLAGVPDMDGVISFVQGFLPDVEEITCYDRVYNRGVSQYEKIAGKWYATHRGTG